MRDVLAVRARPVDRTGLRWLTRLPVRAERDTDLLVSATFANGDVTAELGLERLKPG